MKSLVDGGWHYIRMADAREELYDLESDSLEERNLAGEPELGGELARLRERLEESLAEGLATQHADRGRDLPSVPRR